MNVKGVSLSKRCMHMSTAIGRQHMPEIQATFDTVLKELQLIWDEIGDSDEDRDKMLLQLEQDCLQLYKQKVEQASESRSHLRQTIVDIQSEISSLCSVLEESPLTIQLEKKGGTLRELLAALTPMLEEWQRRKSERQNQCQQIKAQIQRIDCEISGSSEPVKPSEYETVSDDELSLKKFNELQRQLQVLQKEKNDRLYKVLEHVNTVHELCAVLGWEFLDIITEVHPSLDGKSSNNQTKSISDETIQRLAKTTESLREEKKRRIQKVQDFGAALIELWNLMDTPVEEQQLFQHITCNIAASEHEFTEAEALSLDVIEQARLEVERLELLKGSKMKELVLKKRAELEEICRRAHIIPDANTAPEKATASMESGLVDPAELLASIEQQIGSAKEEAFSRKEIMEKMEKWIAACEEEQWLEDYNKDENRYAASRGAHIILKRAERARAAISKIPALVDSLMTKTKCWEEERGKSFLYEGVPLLSTLEEYNNLRLEKDEQRRRQRDHRRLHEHLMNGKAALFGTRTTTTPCKKSSANGNGTPASCRSTRQGTTVPPGGRDLCTPKAFGFFYPRQNSLSRKESRKDRVRSRMVNRRSTREEGNGSSPGERRPLSSVSSPGVQPNMNPVESEHSRSKRRHIGFSPIKNALSKASNPTVRPLSPVADEETTPAQPLKTQHPSRNPLSVTCCSVPAVMDERSTTPQQRSYGSHYEEGHLTEPTEYSFEEKRLGFCYHPMYTMSSSPIVLQT